MYMVVGRVVAIIELTREAFAYCVLWNESSERAI